MLLENAINSAFFSSKNNRSLWIQIAILGLACAAASLLALDSAPGSNRDFLGYWLATHIFFDGKNPYDAATIEAWKSAQNFLGAETLLVWNPPLSYILLAPITLLPINLAAGLWMGLNVVFALGTVLLCWPINHPRRPSVLGLAAVAGLFIPVWFVFSLGQLTLMLVFCSALAIKCIEMQRDRFAGFVLAVLSIKPHISFLFLFFIFLSTLKTRRFALLTSIVAVIVMASVAAELVQPGIHQHWIGSNNWPPVLFGSSFAVALWFAIERFSNPQSLKLLLIAFPLLGLISLGVASMRPRFAPFSKAGYSLALMLTPFFSPYGFIFDQTVMLPLLAWAFAFASADSNDSGRVSVFIWSLLLTDMLIFALAGVTLGPFFLLWYLPIFQALAMVQLFGTRDPKTGPMTAS